MCGEQTEQLAGRRSARVGHQRVLRGGESLSEADARPQGGSEGRERRQQENSGNLLRCAWSPDLSMATCGSSDGFVYIYDTTSLGIKWVARGG